MAKQYVLGAEDMDIRYRSHVDLTLLSLTATTPPGPYARTRSMHMHTRTIPVE